MYVRRIAVLLLGALTGCGAPMAGPDAATITDAAPSIDASRIDARGHADTSVDAPVDAASSDDAAPDVGADARVCTPGATQSCYGGPSGTSGIGACMPGIATCVADGSAFGACIGSVAPIAEDCATTADDDCDGTVNETDAGCLCIPGAGASCYEGPTGTSGVGACAPGTHLCAADGVSFAACTGAITPLAENCATSTDDDCDGIVDEGCACAPGASASCYSGPAGTVGVGPCQMGTHTCAADGLSFGACMGEVTPVAETCTTPIDDDCDGMTNESGVGCVCAPSTTQSCYDGPVGTVGVGACHRGSATCSADGTMLGACIGEVTPVAETCTTPIDDDCDGMTNESGTGCVCTPRSTQSCYDGPAGTNGVGACHAGSATCSADGTMLGVCMGEVTPVAETCTTPIDDDCDGLTNESGTGCVCAPGSTASCYSGPVGTNGVGLCRSGTQTCNSLGTGYGACIGDVIPRAEDCTTAGDDDCDAMTNEGCTTVHYAADVQPIFAAHCAPCHTTFGSGGTNFASSYAASQLASGACAGHTIGYCTLVRVLNGSMPSGGGCTGIPSNDAGNANCLTAAEQTTLSAWIASGQLP